MLRLVVALFALAFLDALSTYVVVATGLGVETNPAVADIINSNPAAVFPLALISAAVLATAVYVATTLSHMLPAWLRAVATRLLTSAFYAMVMRRAAVVVNNLLVILKSTLF
jgi:hypothetical protein